MEELYRVEIEEKNIEIIECLTVLRILNNLGYIKKEEELNNLFENNSIDVEILFHLLEIKYHYYDI